MKEKFDIEYVIIGVIFLLIAIAIIYIDIKNDKVNEENNSSFKYYSVRGAIIFFILSLYLIFREVMKII
ncbi:hypothetical protein IL45_03880 [Nonlabens ulvanivorans]|uniref:Uncharacterized protein n=1 Tax=Nonlabens ulvanivorans TaxID=906888 RepID=A0A084JYG7_NONUL|nr:hypothetical protein IL45_03880 [Nonlabens ulvanivorans]PRX08464.1 hypothetical protein LY02_02923 [Nonlabens ulvanivorans]